MEEIELRNKVWALSNLANELNQELYKAKEQLIQETSEDFDREDKLNRIKYLDYKRHIEALRK